MDVCVCDGGCVTLVVDVPVVGAFHVRSQAAVVLPLASVV